MKSLMTLVTGLLLAFGLTSSANAATRIGVLRCYVDSGSGYIVGSAHDARCTFSNYTGRRERYVARIRRAGLDVGYTGNSMITWAVYAPSDMRRHALIGDYVGASADIAVGIGGGGNILVGGSNRTISLQPLSVKTETGLSVAAGASMLELR